MFGLYRAMLGGGVALSGSSNVQIATVISKRVFPSVWLLISSVALMFGPQEIMSTLFFGAGGGELGDSCSVSLPLLFVETLVFSVGFWSYWLFLSLSGFFSGFLIFVLTAKRGSTFFGRMAFAVVEGAIFAEVVCRRLLW